MTKVPSNSKSSVLFLICSGLLSGLAPKAPGTAGSIAFLAIWACYPQLWGWLSVLLLCVVGTGATLALLPKLDLEDDEHPDPKWIVVDEWAGLAVALCGLTFHNPLVVVVAFILFRLFDILKPFPISAAERLPGAWGIMADDLLAGGIARVICYVLFST